MFFEVICFQLFCLLVYRDKKIEVHKNKSIEIMVISIPSSKCKVQTGDQCCKFMTFTAGLCHGLIYLKGGFNYFSAQYGLKT